MEGMQTFFPCGNWFICCFNYRPKSDTNLIGATAAEILLRRPDSKAFFCLSYGYFVPESGEVDCLQLNLVVTRSVIFYYV